MQEFFHCFLSPEKRFCGRKRRRLVCREGFAATGGHWRASAGQLLTRSDWVLLDAVATAAVWPGNPARLLAAT